MPKWEISSLTYFEADISRPTSSSTHIKMNVWSQKQQWIKMTKKSLTWRQLERKMKRVAVAVALTKERKIIIVLQFRHSLPCRLFNSFRFRVVFVSFPFCQVFILLCVWGNFFDSFEAPEELQLSFLLSFTAFQERVLISFNRSSHVCIVMSSLGK